MGAGATSGVQSVIDETNLTEALSKLSVDDKITFWTAVSESDVKAAVEGSEQMKEEFGKLSDENQQKFYGAIMKVKTDPSLGAPFLELAQEKGKAWNLEQTKNLTPEEMAKMDDPEVKKGWTEKYRAYVMSDLKPLYEKAFKRHDTDSSGKIDREQFGVLQINIVALVKDGIQFAMISYAEPIALMVLGPTGGLDGVEEHSDEKKKATAEKVAAAVPTVIEALLKDYNDNKTAKDDAVFELASADGGIPLDNFMEMMIDGSDLQKKMGEALGFGEETVMTKIAEAVGSA